MSSSTGRCLHELFEVSARANPEHVAVTAADGELTYGELDIRSGELAARLAEGGVRPGTIVGLFAERTTEMVVGLLGILRAGGAYLPLDTAFPADRVRWLLGDSGAKVVVTDSRSAADVVCDTTTIVTVRGAQGDGGSSPALGPSAAPDDLAYLIYTSGTTGTPKGVLVEHRSMVRLLEETAPRFGFGPSDVWTLFHSIAFDFSVWEIWGALTFGGRVVIVPYDVSRSPAAFLALLNREGVTVLNQTPTAFRQLIAAEVARPDADLEALRVVVFGGERLDVGTLSPWIARHGDERPELVNMYGITETTVHASYRRIRRSDLAHPKISPVGVPLPHLDFLLLDESSAPVQDGEPGELYISGEGLARGYLNREDLTASRFVSLPEAPGGRLYRTGDLMARLDDGQYAYLGRNDDQLKVRGFRVEPGEIEAVLTDHPEVASSVVSAHDYGEGDVRLLAYLVPVPGLTPDQTWLDGVQEDLASRVADALPVHMRPSAYLPLAALPLTRNGKIDRAALPAPTRERDHANETEGLTATQSVIADLWCSVLDVASVGLHDDFFDIGGTSLALVRMFDLVNRYFGTDLDISVLLDGADVATLAVSVDHDIESRSSAESRG